MAKVTPERPTIYWTTLDVPDVGGAIMPIKSVKQIETEHYRTELR